MGCVVNRYGVVGLALASVVAISGCGTMVNAANKPTNQMTSKVTHKAIHKAVQNRQTNDTQATPSNGTGNEQQTKPTVALMGQHVQVGSYQIYIPETAQSPVLTLSNKNVFAWGGNPPKYIFIEADVKNLSSAPLAVSDNMFQLTWTPENSSTQYYVGDVTQEYNATIDTKFANPLSHSIAPGTIEKLALVYDIPKDMSPNSIGEIGVAFNSGEGNQMEFALSNLN